MHRSSGATLFRECVAGPTHAPAIGVKAFGLWEGELISSSGATLFRGCVAGPTHAPAIGVKAFGLREGELISSSGGVAFLEVHCRGGARAGYWCEGLRPSRAGVRC